MLIKPDIARFARIKVLGIGGGGNNAVNSMVVGNQIKGVDFVSVNCDAQALLNSQVPTKVQIGENITRGLGAGGNADVGRDSAEESREALKEQLVDTDMVFITAGMGGGTGSGAAPVIAEIAKELGALTVAVVTKPFKFEGTRRMVVAEDAIENLKEKVDTLIVIPNQRLLDTVDKKMTLVEAFRVADSVLEQGVSGISDLITTPGLINVDFADVKAIMQDAGSALMGIGTGVGENRSATAARTAVSSPLLEVSIDGAKGVLFNIVGGTDLTMDEIDQSAKIISEHVDADANIIFGATIDESMVDQIRIIVIATGFDNTKQQLLRMTSPTPQPVQQTQNSMTEQDKPQDDQESQDRQQQRPTRSSSSDLGLPPEEDPWDVPAFLRQKS